MKSASVKYGISLLTDHDIYLFKEGNHFTLYEKLGAHRMKAGRKEGTLFSVWAPNARKVSVMGDFNHWDNAAHQLRPREDGSGIWEGFIPGVREESAYKYHIISHHQRYRADKSDPFAFSSQGPPGNASVVRNLNYAWNDTSWMHARRTANSVHSPLSIYEVHFGSWRRVPEEGNRPLTYCEMAHYLADYVKEMGFTHVEFLPLMEHPFYGSWGYQTTGYFAPTSRYGTPQDLMYLIDHLHQHGIGVIMDWVPSHFPDDIHGLVFFDGTHLYEHSDPKKGFHPDWKSYIFNCGRYEVRSFLISSAMFWLDRYHADGLRVDAVASMLYLDYGREEGEWIPNAYGGKENLEAIHFLKRFNEMVYGGYPDVQTIAEESTAWPMVSRPVYVGGLGFGMKWNMGWMHDTLDYFSQDPVFRKYRHNQLTFSIWYGFAENFVLPLSHDEVVHGKGSLFGKMSGDEWQKFANLRLLFGYMYGHPGKKLLFMGGEIAQWKEWNHEESLEWHVLEYRFHRGVRHWVRDLNLLYRSEPALHDMDFSPEGFQWIDFHNWEESIISFIRKGNHPDDLFLIVCNFTPVPRHSYRIGVPKYGLWKEMLNSDADLYGGSGQGNAGGARTERIPCHGQQYSLSLVLPPLGILFFKCPGHDG